MFPLLIRLIGVLLAAAGRVSGDRRPADQRARRVFTSSAPSPVLYQLPDKSSSYVRTLDSVLETRTKAWRCRRGARTAPEASARLRWKRSVSEDLPQQCPVASGGARSDAGEGTGGGGGRWGLTERAPLHPLWSTRSCWRRRSRPSLSDRVPLTSALREPASLWAHCWPQRCVQTTLQGCQTKPSKTPWCTWVYNTWGALLAVTMAYCFYKTLHRIKPSKNS